jgi:hypothetical protein
MASFIMAARNNARQGEPPPSWVPHLQRLHGGVEVLVGPPGAEAASGLDREIAPFGGLIGGEGDVIADCGRFQPGMPGQRAVLDTADRILFLVRPEPADVAHLRAALKSLRTGDAEREVGSLGAETRNKEGAIDIVVVGSGTVDARQIAGVLGVPVIGMLPDDPVTARAMAGRPTSSRAVRAGRLARAARDLVAHCARSDRPKTAEGKDLADDPERPSESGVLPSGLVVSATRVSS